ncbi:hypothetical protein Tco_1115407, partial [Tanacetum coccineum]
KHSSISNCTTTSQVKFATCTLQDDALTWWNSHVKTTTPEVAHAMHMGGTEEILMTENIYPRGEIKKIELKCETLRDCGYGPANNNNNTVNQQLTTTDKVNNINNRQGNAGKKGLQNRFGMRLEMLGGNPDNRLLLGTILFTTIMLTSYLNTGAGLGWFRHLLPFSTLLDIVPNTLDLGYNIALADG